MASVEGAPRLSQLFDRRDNNILLLRLLAALLVLWHHSWALTRTPDEPLHAHGADPGALALAIFFCLSGFLVTHSWLRRGSAAPYLLARATRIFPALWLSVLVCAFIVGPLATTLDLKQYFAHVRLRQFIAADMLLIQPRFDLPAVFERNPLAWAVNGSLWTLPYEILFYGTVAVTGRWIAGRWSAWGLFAAVLALNISLSADANTWAQHLAGSPFSPEPMSRFLSYFLMGALACRLAQYIPIHRGAALGLGVLAVLLPMGPLSIPISAAVFCYELLCLAAWRGPWTQLSAQMGDYSYGLYLYGMPVQQLLILTFPSTTPVILTVVSLPIALGVAIFSWHLVEAPALRLWQRRAPRRSESAGLPRPLATSGAI